MDADRQGYQETEPGSRPSGVHCAPESGVRGVNYRPVGEGSERCSEPVPSAPFACADEALAEFDLSIGIKRRALGTAEAVVADIKRDLLDLQQRRAELQAASRWRAPS